MAGQFPVWNDDEVNLWKKIDLNFFNYCFSLGITDLNGPSPNDDREDLIKKICYASARLADHG